MLLSGQVDAFAAVDFRDRLSADTLEKLSAGSKISLKNKIPVAFRVSNKLYDSDPTFTGKFRTALKFCREQRPKVR